MYTKFIGNLAVNVSPKLLCKRQIYLASFWKPVEKSFNLLLIGTHNTHEDIVAHLYRMIFVAIAHHNGHKISFEPGKEVLFLKKATLNTIANVDLKNFFIIVISIKWSEHKASFNSEMDGKKSSLF